MRIPNTQKQFLRWITTEHAQNYPVTPQHIALAKQVALEGWKIRANERGVAEPVDLSGSCKFSSLFVKCLFGGALRGNKDHQFNLVRGKVVDINEAAQDVSTLRAAAIDVYEHDTTFFGNSEHLESMLSCVPRVTLWVQRFATLALEIYPPEMQKNGNRIIPLTRAIIHLSDTLIAAQSCYKKEADLAELLGIRASQSVDSRCRALFITGLASYTDAMGLQRTEENFQALLDLQVSSAMRTLSDEDLAAGYLFSPSIKGKRYMCRLPAPDTQPQNHSAASNVPSSTSATSHPH